MTGERDWGEWEDFRSAGVGRRSEGYWMRLTAGYVNDLEARLKLAEKEWIAALDALEEQGEMVSG